MLLHNGTSAKKTEYGVQEVIVGFDTFEQGKSRSVIGLEKQLAAIITAYRTGGLDRIQYYSGHALQLLWFSSLSPESDLLPSPLLNVQSAHGSPGLAANVVPCYAVLKRVSRPAEYFPPRINISGFTAAALGDEPCGTPLRWLRGLTRSSRARPISHVKNSLHAASCRYLGCNKTS